MTQSHDNFCPQCGHRNYQHGKDGCEHVDVSRPDVLDLIREDHVFFCENRCSCGFDCDHDYLNYIDHLVDYRERWAVKAPCECTRPHPLMVGVT